MYQLVNDAGYFFALSIGTGKIVFNNSKELGYTFPLDTAEEVKQKLIGLGYTNISIVKY